jgi:hypothetical protein
MKPVSITTAIWVGGMLLTINIWPIHVGNVPSPASKNPHGVKNAFICFDKSGGRDTEQSFRRRKTR